ncbi:MAG: DUF4296 domain-containing protein [Clostridium sp.]|nr:DUF4296 domain-containing protein [Bacteroides sp.]MCM1199219.1 DUF4296 domain-containing protein [Clostridium sp.]
MALTVLLSACRREGKVIPRDKMARIYAEMFIVDQKISQDREIRRTADTSLVYEPVFRKYGYTADDYRASMAHYIKDPDRYARILRNSASIIESEIKSLKKERERLEALEKLHDEVSAFSPDRIFRLTGLGNPDLFTEDSLSFYVDSTGGDMYFDVRVWLDTAFYGPVMQLRERDTLSVQDSVAVELPENAPDGAAVISDKDTAAGNVPSKLPELRKGPGPEAGNRPPVPEDRKALRPSRGIQVNDKVEVIKNVEEKK